jgi:hypothetical protein
MTNTQIAASENLWNEYYNTSAFPENEFGLFSYDERLAMLDLDYPDLHKDMIWVR